jgi:hypothetical protein
MFSFSPITASRFLPGAELLPWLGGPLTVLGIVALLLWSGRIRQPLPVNLLALGVMLPLMQFCLIAVAGHALSQHLAVALLNLSAALPG